MLKKIISGLIALSMAVVLASCSGQNAAKTDTQNSETQITLPQVTGEFKTTVLKSGKSDAIILESAEKNVLIDCGEENDGDKIVEYLNSQGKTRVDYLFITHFDQDHVGGVPYVMENMEVGEIITPNYEGNNNEYEVFKEALERLGKETTKLTENMTLTLDDVVYQIYPPLKSSYKTEDNDFSLVIKATHGEDTFLFTGDAMDSRIEELYSQIGDLSADFLKVPYHGNLLDSSEKFIKSVSPSYAVITCNKKEGADSDVISMLESEGAQTYLNRDGTVTAVSSGSGITVTQAASAEE